MYLSLRELNVFGMLIAPGAAMLVVSTILYLLLRSAINHFVDLNRFVWRRPLIDIALFVILYSVAILTLKLI